MLPNFFRMFPFGSRTRKSNKNRPLAIASSKIKKKSSKINCVSTSAPQAKSKQSHTTPHYFAWLDTKISDSTHFLFPFDFFHGI